jgi:signal transduction histidine kinase
MFQSATFKLTSWYLGIIIAVSLLFSLVIYTIATRELSNRIGIVKVGGTWAETEFRLARDDQLHQAEASLIFSLAVTNICIWTIGGVGSYYLARRTLQPIEEAHEAQSRFVSDASHELRTPLASMKTELEVALYGPPLTKRDMTELLQSNLEEVDKLTQLAGTLLQLAKLDATAITSEKVSIQAAVQASVKRFGANAKRIHIEKTLFSLEAKANRLQTEELVTILVDNALKYSSPNSKVHITFLKEKQLVGFAVRNQGKGIARTVLPRIFERFYRAERSRTSTDAKGFGLGLALAKKIVELHHGELSVSSAPDAPTTFRVLLPKFTNAKSLEK